MPLIRWHAVVHYRSAETGTVEVEQDQGMFALRPGDRRPAAQPLHRT
jgi:hypothetical protein